VAKVSYAEVIAENGIENAFISCPLMTESKIERELHLSQMVTCSGLWCKAPASLRGSER
jgi:hypothetical protein